MLQCSLVFFYREIFMKATDVVSVESSNTLGITNLKVSIIFLFLELITSLLFILFFIALQVEGAK